MPRVLTDQYRNVTFCLPFSGDKSECAWVKPLTETEINRLRQDAAKEAGADEELAGKYLIRGMLLKSITGWQGFYDAGGKDIPCTPEMIREICECDPDFCGGTGLADSQRCQTGRA